MDPSSLALAFVLESWVFKPPTLEIVPFPTEVVATAYCPCPVCCGKWSGGPTASGRRPRQGRTLAADWKVFPKGACLEIQGIGKRRVEDTGRLIKDNKVDVFYRRHIDAKRFARKVLSVKPC